jgi:RimJ/RimL family protein N-acetyltransferase
LTTGRLILRGFRASDYDDYAALNADPAVRAGLDGKLLTRDQSWAQMETFMGQWALRGYGIFAVEIDGCLAGRAGILQLAGWPEPELAWTLAVAFWGRGFATEAAAATRDWAFSTLGWDRLVSYIRPTNQRSRRVAEKLGAALESRIEFNGKVADVWVHTAPDRTMAIQYRTGPCSV